MTEELRERLHTVIVLLLMTSDKDGFIEYEDREDAIKEIELAYREAGYKSPEEVGTTSQWFEKGRKSVLRTNPSGCSCLFDEQENIVQVCGAHQDWFEEKTKYWKSPEEYCEMISEAYRGKLK